MTTSMKSVTIVTAITLSTALFLAFSTPALAGSKIQHAYLMPAEEGLELYPDAIAKLTRNCDTGEIILRGHGLTAGNEYEIRSGGALTGQKETAVGNGVAGRGNNVLIKEIKEDEAGGYWNLWEGETRILRAPKVACSQE